MATAVMANLSNGVVRDKQKKQNLFLMMFSQPFLISFVFQFL
jgi:hypothetical protein